MNGTSESMSSDGLVLVRLEIQIDWNSIDSFDARVKVQKLFFVNWAKYRLLCTNFVFSIENLKGHLRVLEIKTLIKITIILLYFDIQFVTKTKIKLFLFVMEPNSESIFSLLEVCHLYQIF